MENGKTVDEVIREFNEAIEAEEEAEGNTEIAIAEEADEEIVETDEEAESTDADVSEEDTPEDAGEAASERTAEPPKVDDAEAKPDAEKPEETTKGDKEDFDTVAAKDFEEYKKLYPDTKSTSFLEIPNVRQFARYRGMGLSVEDAAYLSNRGEHERKAGEAAADAAATHAASKSHLRSSAPSKPTGGSDARISRSTLEWARETYPDMSDKEIEALYKRATK